jgi:hypothetical protein
MHERRLSTTDLLFARLDRQRIPGRTFTWITEILGIFVEGSEAWVQVASEGRPSTSVLLRMSPRGSIARALTALEAWTDFPRENRPSVIDAR